MHIIYDDRDAPRADGSYRLIFLNSGWYIVANGYLCTVADEHDGRRTLVTLSAGSRRGQASIDSSPAPSYTRRSPQQ